MTQQIEFRRYLVNIDTVSTPQVFTDCLIIGAGIAGLRAAIEAAKSCSVTIISKDTLQNSNTYHAQGGIASVLNETDSFESHINDTLNTGCGLSNESIVNLVIKQGPGLVEQLLEWGADFDMNGSQIATTLEGGHAQPRVAHAHGDRTGQVIADTLIKKVRNNPDIKIMENSFCIDLLTNSKNSCVGAVVQSDKGPQIIWSENTILATGGGGRLYRETTNPDVATGDGIAIAYRAGAILRDLEFIQFHPTTLYIAGASRALITEALRGEGAILLNNEHEAFMKSYHPSAELAPRDIVSRAILSEMLKTGTTHVYLDVSHFDKSHFAKRFPLISELCESFDIDVSKELIPVRPSAHYMIGGVKTDFDARTNINNLYACGEIASVGLHGANRLASNSLLEGLVFGKAAGHNAAQCSGPGGSDIKHHRIKYTIANSDRTRLDTSDVLNSLRSLMWRNVGITRTDHKLSEAQEIISFWQRYVMDKVFDRPEGWQCQNMLTTSLLMANAAQKRCESRGVHFRSDFAEINDKKFKKHFEVKNRP